MEWSLRQGLLSGLRPLRAPVLDLSVQDEPRRGSDSTGDGYRAASGMASGKVIIITIAAGPASPAGIGPLTLAAHGEQGPGLIPLHKHEKTEAQFRAR